ncbi:response regulator [Mucilaginibacter paludis]|uniref:Response regulator receiver protein n=1 Tax=Mucilaginibacter paludis DSM 18603 TaxID=714943 RepID=H1Y0T5_9SPHI|nr:response regulator [Mucilaginibacter paludis]EHQ28825.1 response regulator receiver protein [Mucilaginibacter paludis DSM 18603]
MPNTLKKILIADDDEAIVDSTALLLEVMGYQVSQTLDGSKISKAMQNKPDLVLLDIWMSGVDGRDICRQMKANPDTQNIPVLMISASRDVKQSAFDSGANDFLEKPFEMDALINKIATLIG